MNRKLIQAHQSKAKVLQDVSLEMPLASSVVNEVQKTATPVYMRLLEERANARCPPQLASAENSHKTIAT